MAARRLGGEAAKAGVALTATVARWQPAGEQAEELTGADTEDRQHVQAPVTGKVPQKGQGHQYHSTPRYVVPATVGAESFRPPQAPGLKYSGFSLIHG